MTITLNSVQKKKIETELYESFNSFLKFTFNLIHDIEKNDDNYKFAVVNMQISLELFLKYYFVRNNDLNGVVKKVNGDIVTFKDFSQVLNYFFSTHRWTSGSKKELMCILDLRNAIVHNGRDTEIDSKVADYIIKCIFFMHDTMNNEFDESLIKTLVDFNLEPNRVWISGVESFISDYIQGQVVVCPGCENYTMVTKEELSIENVSEIPDIDELVCLSCFWEAPIGTALTLIECNDCEEESLFIDILNPQDEQICVGYCSECKERKRVRMCKECETYCCEIESHKFSINNTYFCSDDCLEDYKENWGLVAIR